MVSIFLSDSEATVFTLISSCGEMKATQCKMTTDDGHCRGNTSVMQYELFSPQSNCLLSEAFNQLISFYIQYCGASEILDIQY